MQAASAPRDTTERDTTRKRADVAADSLVATMVDSTRVQQLFGNVQVDQDSTRIISEQAIRFLQQSAYLFTGDVVLVERGDTLMADTVRYDEQRKIGRARGDVRLTDGDLFVRAPSGQYFADEKRSEFREGVTLVDSTSTLTSNAGTYFSDEERAEFYGDVRFEDDDTYLEADSVTYFRSTGNTIARGRVYIQRKGGESAAADSTTRTYLFGHFARNEKTRSESIVRGRALLVQIETDSAGAPSDTLLVRAHRLRSTRTDSLRRLIALDSVRIWQPDIAATADSVVYDRIARGDSGQVEETRLYRNPITWFEGSQVSGDTIRVKARNRSVDTVHVVGNAFAAQRDTSVDRINQLKGRTITAYFRADSLRRINTQPNAETIRFLKNENDGLDGAVKASADQIVMWFRAGDLHRVGVYRDVQSEVYDPAVIPEPFQLDGFRWIPEQQPTKNTLLDERARDRLVGNVVVVRSVSGGGAAAPPHADTLTNQ
jgi:lipopolysaccharide export system protein LptA